jgi:hypothetical protein
MLKERWQKLGIDRRLKAIYEKYERILIPGFLVVGFNFDVVTFRTLEVAVTLQLLFVYAIVAGLTLAYIHIYDARQDHKKVVFGYLRFLAPLVSQISFGALLSSALLFYWFSGSFSVSWPLFALITGVMISSEIFRNVYMKPAVQFSVYNFVMLSYFSVLLPFVLRSLSGWIFILSGILSTLIVVILVLLLTKISPQIEKQRLQILGAVLSVFVLMSAFYFFKLIPPLPLSIREAGIYHDIVRLKKDYTLVGEEETFWQGLLPGQTIHASLSESVYAYTAIFAPADLSTVIYHRWEYKDPATGKWVERGLLSFTARGGRPEGYRGYTRKTGLNPGRWRVTVENSRGQVLGRLPFTVETP